MHDRLNVGVLCAAAGLAAVLASWIVLLAGFALFAFLVYRDAHRGRRRLRGSFPRIPDSSAFNHTGVRGAVDGIVEAQRERLSVVEACPDDALLVLASVLRSAAQAEAEALRLAHRTDRLHRYLATKDVACMRATLGSAQQAARGARSPGERASYDAAARAYEIALETVGGIDLAMRAGVARLEDLRAALAVIPPRIVKWQAASEALADEPSAALPGEILAATSEIAEAEEHLCALSRGEAPFERARIEEPAPCADRPVRVSAPGPEPEAPEPDELSTAEILRHIQI